jgi:hypothetical protein
LVAAQATLQPHIESAKATVQPHIDSAVAATQPHVDRAKEAAREYLGTKDLVNGPAPLENGHS